MEEPYIVAAVEVSKAIRFYTARLSHKQDCEQELAEEGLSVLVWGEGTTEENAMAQAMQLTALQMALRLREE
jgi:hypothetical protein